MIPILFVPEDRGQTAYLVQAEDFSARLGIGAIDLRSRAAGVHIVFPGSTAIAPRGFNAAGARISRIQGTDPAMWQTGLPAFQGVVYPELYSGITLRVMAAGGEWKSEFVVEPGANPAQIRVRYEGAEHVEVAADGSMLVATTTGEWREDPPVLYQLGPSGRRTVEGRFAVIDAQTVGFEIGEYDRTLPLIVDPTLTYSSVLGGSGMSVCTGAAADAEGNIYLTGYTDAADFPTAHPASARGGGVDAVVVKLNPNTGQLIYATYIGGSQDDRAMRITVDTTGAAYVTGSTTSPNFPQVAAAQTSLHGYRDAFLVKLSPAGDRIEFATYFGGAGSEVARAITVGQDAVWIAGESDSADLPAGAGFQSCARGRTDGFLARYSLTGELLNASYLGGSGDDSPRALCLHPSGALLVAGATDSGDFPSIGAIAGISGTGQDAFLALVSPGLNAIQFCGRIGGSAGDSSQQESVESIAVDAGGAVYLGGSTPSVDFPLKEAYQPTYGGLGDGFLMKIDLAAKQLVWSTFYGGWDRDSIAAIAVDDAGRVYAAGSTISANLPQIAALQNGYKGNRDAFLLRLEAGGNGISFASYLGGAGSDQAVAAGLVPPDRMWVAGQTASADFPLQRSVQSLTSTALKFFAAEVMWSAQPQPVSVTPSAGSALAQVFTVRFRHTDGAASLNTLRFWVSPSESQAAACMVTYTRGDGALRLANDDGSGGTAVRPGVAEEARNSQCVLSGYAASYAEAGTDIVLTLPLTFSTSFGGAKILYADATDVSGQSSGTRVLGAFTVVFPNLPPAAVRVSPAGAAGGGVRQQFTFQYSDPDGAADIQGAYILFNRVPDARYGCYLYFDRGAGLIYLADDSASGFAVLHPGTTETLQNSQCLLEAAGSSFTASGTDLSLTLQLTFKSSLNGVTRISSDVEDSHGGSSGFHDLGAYTLAAANQTPQLVSVTPDNGVGNGTTFAITVSDGNGIADLLGVQVLISRAGGSGAGCFLTYFRGSGSIWLTGDSGVPLSFARIRTSDIADNSYCQVSGIGVSSTETANSFTVRIPVQFKATLTGLNQIVGQALDQEGISSGISQKGTYTVGAALNRPPEVVSVSPVNTSGDGSPATFTFTYRDADGASDIRGAYAAWNWYPDGHYACFVYYDRETNLLYLADDDATVFTPIHLGSAETIQNGQCILYATGSSAVASGTTLTLAVRLAMKESLNGTQRIYSDVEDLHGGSSGYNDLGYFVMTAANHTPVLAPAAPNSGVGTGDTFVFSASDANGINDLSAIQVLISKPGYGGDAGCFVSYYRNSGSIWLMRDGGTGWQEAKLGTSAALENSYCTVNVPAVMVIETGGTMNLHVPIQFKPPMTGLNQILGHALDMEGVTSGFGFKGTYAVGGLTNRPPQFAGRARRRTAGTAFARHSLSTSTTRTAHRISPRCSASSLRFRMRAMPVTSITTKTRI